VAYTWAVDYCSNAKRLPSQRTASFASHHLEAGHHLLVYHSEEGSVLAISPRFSVQYVYNAYWRLF